MEIIFPAHWKVLLWWMSGMAPTEVIQLPATVIQSGNLRLWQAWLGMLKRKQKEMTFWSTCLFWRLALQIRSVKRNQFTHQHIFRKIALGSFMADVIFLPLFFKSLISSLLQKERMLRKRMSVQFSICNWTISTLGVCYEDQHSGAQKQKFLFCELKLVWKSICPYVFIFRHFNGFKTVPKVCLSLWKIKKNKGWHMLSHINEKMNTWSINLHICCFAVND